MKKGVAFFRESKPQKVGSKAEKIDVNISPMSENSTFRSQTKLKQFKRYLRNFQKFLFKKEFSYHNQNPTNVA